MLVNNFNKIKKAYDDFQRDLLSQGRLLAKDTGIGYWGVTPVAETFEFFKKFGLHSYQNFIDIGSGDGRIVFLASIFGPESHGIEADEELVNFSIQHKARLDISGIEKTKFMQKDFMHHDLTVYDVIYINPDKPFFRDNLNNKIVKELNGKLIVHGWEFHPQSLRKIDEQVINGEKFSVYMR